MSLPQPIPYQGSKRLQAPFLLRYIPNGTEVLYEPFAGSGAVTIGAAYAGFCKAFVLSDSFDAVVGIWNEILTCPTDLADAYSFLWNEQLSDPRSYFDVVRAEFNRHKRPAHLLYLLARCVKNSVRFNSKGEFNQSPDNRRLGTRPETMRDRILSANKLLSSRTTALCSDYGVALREASANDVVYMDPPYVGVGGMRDNRYYQQLDYDRFVSELEEANSRGVRYMVSFDGQCGEKTYGPGLPSFLGLVKIDLHVGRSSQATLIGRKEQTVETLHLSKALVSHLPSSILQVRKLDIKAG